MSAYEGSAMQYAEERSGCPIHKNKFDDNCLLCDDVKAMRQAPPTINWQERAVKAEARVKELDEALGRVIALKNELSDKVKELEAETLAQGLRAAGFQEQLKNMTNAWRELREQKEELVRLLEATRPAIEYCRDKCVKSQHYLEAVSYVEALKLIDAALAKEGTAKP